MKLTPRLKYISELVSDGKKIADIGTDHGYIPISLLLDKKISFAILSDINRGPLNNAKKEVTKNNVQNYVDLRLGSGMETLRDGEVDQVIIAGMGGILISEIIEKKIELSKNLDKLILQPMQAPEELRRYLSKNGFKIIDEHFVREDHRIYEIIEAVYDKALLTENQDDEDFEQKKYTQYIYSLFKNNGDKLIYTSSYYENIKKKINHIVKNHILKMVNKNDKIVNDNVFDEKIIERKAIDENIIKENAIEENTIERNAIDENTIKKNLENEISKLSFEVSKLMIAKRDKLFEEFLEKKIYECESIVSKMIGINAKDLDDTTFETYNENVKNKVEQVVIRKIILDLLKYDIK
ncbi:class I SAM-dependent methyltransferase [Peptostreptococcus porci]|uniref:class I SAM-dependent methyltransferase n=1 Tax=Peptostreptococcus porci TaxID=2652282 RepID=UPI002A7EE60E|nr:tRNA (adenine(22)-N(1))-methyltransferase TrmK [Peptostreptococcus porci]MDY4129195.1 tRNA (adenine(22)-N(1))-methyltransferase TrmK [Peptostreptococcus porci]MDY5436348.1 tRNA (adenine(22)-N(1))-methyltransferase TrmK [Peptostreptococcus porci]